MEHMKNANMDLPGHIDNMAQQIFTRYFTLQKYWKILSVTLLNKIAVFIE